MSAELTSLTIADAAERIRSRQLSPVELTEAYLARIDRLNPSINAYVTVTAERARADAKRAADEIASGTVSRAAPRHPNRTEGPVRHCGHPNDGGFHHL